MTLKRRTTTIVSGATVTAVTIYLLVWMLCMRPVGAGLEETIEIPSGMTAADVADLLKERGLIRCPLYFRLTAKWYGLATAFKAGIHTVPGGLTPYKMAILLTEIPPAPPDITVTVFEGLNIIETASLLDGIAAIDSASFVSAATDTAVVHKLGIDKQTLEGYLYPDTYYISHDTTAEEMIGRMVMTFYEVFADSLVERVGELGMTVDDVVTLASIIELEAGNNGEREIVSQVFHRRLELGRPLEANPTIQYAIGEKRRVLTEDLSVDSPYNTYTHHGLPPGPIASPGRESIVAALYPSDTSYLYFMADGEGGHVFSQSLEEHNRAVNAYRQLRRLRSSQ